MVKEKELTKLKEDNMLLVKQLGDRKENKRSETIAQVCCELLGSGKNMENQLQ